MSLIHNMIWPTKNPESQFAPSGTQSGKGKPLRTTGTGISAPRDKM